MVLGATDSITLFSLFTLILSFLAMKISGFFTASPASLLKHKGDEEFLYFGAKIYKVFAIQTAPSKAHAVDFLFKFASTAGM
jgi:hypothetical protein